MKDAITVVKIGSSAPPVRPLYIFSVAEIGMSGICKGRESGVGRLYCRV